MKKFMLKLTQSFADAILNTGIIGVLSIGLFVLFKAFGWMIILLMILLTALSMIKNRKD